MLVRADGKACALPGRAMVTNTGIAVSMAKTVTAMASLMTGAMAKKT